jgi:hypothetical protein
MYIVSLFMPYEIQKKMQMTGINTWSFTKLTTWYQNFLNSNEQGLYNKNLKYPFKIFFSLLLRH